MRAITRGCVASRGLSRVAPEHQMPSQKQKVLVRGNFWGEDACLWIDTVKMFVGCVCVLCAVLVFLLSDEPCLTERCPASPAETGK